MVTLHKDVPLMVNKSVIFSLNLFSFSITHVLTSLENIFVFYEKNNEFRSLDNRNYEVAPDDTNLNRSITFGVSIINPR